MVLATVNITPMRSPPGVRSQRLNSVSLPSSFGGIQVLSHEVMLVSGRMILKNPKDAEPELFVKWSCLKTEGVKERIGASALNRTLHQLAA
jgi:hypothetical protein